jgi:hypothetical protein
MHFGSGCVLHPAPEGFTPSAVGRFLEPVAKPASYPWSISKRAGKF